MEIDVVDRNRALLLQHQLSQQQNGLYFGHLQNLPSTMTIPQNEPEVIGPGRRRNKKELFCDVCGDTVGFYFYFIFEN